MLNALRRNTDRSLPREFLEWQVRLRAWTMVQRNGAPHPGVAPVLCVQQPGVGPGVTMHGIICGLLPAAAQLAERTKHFRDLYEQHAGSGARGIYDAGIQYLSGGYYTSPDDFDPTAITSLLPTDAPAVKALQASGRCGLLFYVFDLDDRTEEGRFRCWQVNCRAEVAERGPEFDNVWWHNALFHGKVDNHAVIVFRHESTYETRFGGLDRVDN